MSGNFQLQQTSPAINAGVVISGINDGYFGTGPDMGAIEYVGNVPFVQTLLLEKSDGSFWLLLWNRVAVYNQSVKADIINAPVSVSIATVATHTWTLYTPSVSASGTVIGTGTSVTVDVPDELIIVKIS